MWRILQHPTSDDWVLATGHATSVREFAFETFKKVNIHISWHGSGISEIGLDQYGTERIKIDPRHFRPTEVPHLLGDASKAGKLLGWKPKYNLNDLIEDMVQEELKLF